jgi:hypothetical protein
MKASMIVGALALIALLWFLGSLAARLREAGEPRLAAIAFGGGVVAIAIVLVGFSLNAALVRIAGHSPDQVKAWYDAQFVELTFVGFPAAVLGFATTIASWRARIFPAWYNAASGLASLVFLTSGGALAQTGFYAPDGAYGLIALIVFAAWVLVTSALLVSLIEKAPATRAVPAG